jgi:hypothetical protein
VSAVVVTHTHANQMLASVGELIAGH